MALPCARELYEHSAALEPLFPRDSAGKLRELAADTQQDYFSIWVAQNLQGKKADADAQLSSETAKTLGMNWFWPANIAGFLLGQMNEADFLNAAVSPDAKKTGISQAWYYVGMKQLLAGNKTVATEDFKKCLAANPNDERTAFLAREEVKAGVQ